MGLSQPIHVTFSPSAWKQSWENPPTVKQRQQWDASGLKTRVMQIEIGVKLRDLLTWSPPQMISFIVIITTEEEEEEEERKKRAKERICVKI